MKAWVVICGEDFGSWSSLVHADTRGKAIQSIRIHISSDNEFIEFRALRKKGLDDKPITYENAKEAGFEYLDEYGSEPLSSSEFINDCHCEICRKE